MCTGQNKLFEFIHKYCVTNVDILFSKHLNLKLDIKSLLYISFDEDILTSATQKHFQVRCPQNSWVQEPVSFHL